MNDHNNRMATRRRLSRQTRYAALLLAALAVGTWGCSEHQDMMDPGDNEAVEIELRNFEFSRPELRIAAGTTVRWRNTTDNFHTVTPDGHTAWTEWQTAGNGETFTVRFDVRGTYPYHCMPHRALGMMGVIIVE